MKGGRVIGSFLCLQATDSAIGLPCLTLRRSQSAETAPSSLLTTKRPLSPNNSCAVCDFCMALGVRFMFNGSLREEQTSLPLLCTGLFCEGKGPRTGEVVSWLLLSASLPHTVTDLIWPLYGSKPHAHAVQKLKDEALDHRNSSKSPQRPQINSNILFPAAQEVHSVNEPTLTGDIMTIKTYHKSRVFFECTSSNTEFLAHTTAFGKKKTKP